MLCIEGLNYERMNSNRFLDASILHYVKVGESNQGSTEKQDDGDEVSKCTFKAYYGEQKRMWGQKIKTSWMKVTRMHVCECVRKQVVRDGHRLDKGACSEWGNEVGKERLLMEINKSGSSERRC